MKISTKKFTIVVSILLPIVVAALFGIKIPNAKPLTFLPPIYASINGFTAILLIVAVIAIKKGHRKLHERLMKLCLILSTLFIIMYVAYHTTSNSTPYGGIGVIRYVYFFIHITHIILSIAIIPLILITVTRALSGMWTQHKKLAKIAFPLWLYVAISGVIVYLMISPYY